MTAASNRGGVVTAGAFATCRRGALSSSEIEQVRIRLGSRATPAQVAKMLGRSMRSREEYRLQVAVARFLGVSCPDLLWSHFPAGEARDEITGGKLKAMGLKRGWPDIILCCPDGVLGAIELKAEGGKLSADQKLFAETLEASRGRFALCRSLEDVEAALKAWSVPMRARAA
ncbi:hypothetical protein LTR94_023850 [Friedmanniomyces endolithicus]|nr:hypothetical protein LTR94_023850 [Friedmanniomyces endolithicus]